MNNRKFILDACCGGRMFWINKHHPNAIYQDIRTDILPLKDKYKINFSVEPDINGDFRNMVFKDKEFKMIIFDPPHLMLNNTAWMAKKYGTLKGTDYKEDIKKGFEECWRVLDDFGTLIFKWNDGSIDINKIRPLFPSVPIIFNRIGTKGKSTWWFVFLKIPISKEVDEDDVQGTQNEERRESGTEVEVGKQPECGNESTPDTGERGQDTNV